MLSVLLKWIPLFFSSYIHYNFGILITCLSSSPNAEASKEVGNGEEKGFKGSSDFSYLQWGRTGELGLSFVALMAL